MNISRYQNFVYRAGGRFGRVIAATDSNLEGHIVAVKIIELKYNRKEDYKRILREMVILCHLRSHYCLWLMNVMKTVKDGSLVDVRLVTPLMDFDLKTVMMKYNLRYVQMVHIMFQLLMALKYLYDAEIIHRDLKPSNIGINKNMELKLLDFGLARDINGDMTEYVVTRWYRPIEVFCGPNYTTAVDMWSAGCIFAELFLKRVLFKGLNQIDQVASIIKILGFPNREMLSLVENENIVIGMRLYESMASPSNILDQHIRSDIEKFVCDEDEGSLQSSDEVVQLICSMIHLDWNLRLKSEEALGTGLFERHKSILACYPHDNPPQKYRCTLNIDHDSDEALREKLIERIDNFKESSF